MGFDGGAETGGPWSSDGLYITAEPESGALFRLPESEVRYEAGDQVTDAVLLVEKLAEGAMGEIWRAHHSGVGRDVAIKLISRRAWEHRNARRRMKREATLAARVSHPHVVTMLDHGWTRDEVPYLVMELLCGRSLEDELALRGHLDVHEVGTLVEQLTGALAAVHELEIIHRDIKPANVFLAREPEDELFAKLVDFGIATGQDTTDLTATGVLLGTPLYMNPERLFGTRGVDHLSDLWALSVVAYECLTGRVPFLAKKLPDFVALMRDVRLVPPSKLRPTLPKSLDRFFARALAKDLEDRFQDAMSMAEAFADAVGTPRPIRGVDGPAISVEMGELSRSEETMLEEVLILAERGGALGKGGSEGAARSPEATLLEGLAPGVDPLAETGRRSQLPSDSTGIWQADVAPPRSREARPSTDPRVDAARSLSGAVTAAVEVGDLVAARAAAKALLRFVEALDGDE